jgi:hypothetical protein
VIVVRASDEAVIVDGRAAALLTFITVIGECIVAVFPSCIAFTSGWLAARGELVIGWNIARGELESGETRIPCFLRARIRRGILIGVGISEELDVSKAFVS